MWVHRRDSTTIAAVGDATGRPDGLIYHALQNLNGCMVNHMNVQIYAKEHGISVNQALDRLLAGPARTYHRAVIAGIPGTQDPWHGPIRDTASEASEDFIRAVQLFGIHGQMRAKYLCDQYSSRIEAHYALRDDQFDDRPPYWGHFRTYRLPAGNGYAWTLLSRLGDMLNQAQKLYGPRDLEWTILGVEFGNNSAPNIWFPGSYENRKNIVIQLEMSAWNDRRRALYQLAHECIHLLAPDIKPPAKNIEEGLATIFSELYIRQLNMDVPKRTGHYIAAAKLVEDLLQRHPDAILKLREREPAFHQWNPDLFISAGIDLPGHLARALCQRLGEPIQSEG